MPSNNVFQYSKIRTRKRSAKKSIKTGKKWNPPLFGIRNPLCWNPESSTRDPESTAWNPESKTVLDSLTQGEFDAVLSFWLFQDFIHRLKIEKHQLYTGHKKTASQQSPAKKHSLAGLKCNPAVSFQTVQMNTTFQVINVFMSPPRFTKTLTINPPLLPTVELCLLERLTKETKKTETVVWD